MIDSFLFDSDRFFLCVELGLELGREVLYVLFLLIRLVNYEFIQVEDGFLCVRLVFLTFCFKFLVILSPFCFKLMNFDL